MKNEKRVGNQDQIEQRQTLHLADVYWSTFTLKKYPEQREVLFLYYLWMGSLTLLYSIACVFKVCFGICYFMNTTFLKFEFI